MMTKLINSEHGDRVPFPRTARMAAERRDKNYRIQETLGSSSFSSFTHGSSPADGSPVSPESGLRLGGSDS